MTPGPALWPLAGLLLFASLPATPLPAAESLAVDPADARLARRPDLVAKLASSPHAYFRFVNAGFAAGTCAAFADVRDSLPDVSLHGDAHVEQYAVTSLGRGLTDFDDCTRGKPVIDLVRFGTSLVLAAREKGWQREEAARAIDEFLRGYRDGLGAGQLEMRTPAVVTRIRARFAWRHAPALHQAHELIDAAPLPVDTFADAVARFSELVRFTRELPDDFFKVKRIGALTMGIGSALDEKYLLLFEGQTAAPEDDLVVEAKQVRTLAGNPCLRTDIGASRVLDGQRTIAYEPFAYAAVVAHGDRFFWMHDWTDDYREASLTREIASARDLREIAYDAGVQMGRAHPKRSDGSRDETLRRQARAAIDRHEPRVRGSMQQMADAVEAAWRTFRDAAGSR
jgi:uncharacterized protein (DUF2252 family)